MEEMERQVDEDKAAMNTETLQEKEKSPEGAAQTTENKEQPQIAHLASKGTRSKLSNINETTPSKQARAKQTGTCKEAAIINAECNPDTT